MFYLDAQRGADGGRIYKVKTSYRLPLARTRDGEYKVKSGEGLMVCLTSDFFIEEADEWRGEVWEMIKQRPDVNFRLQTKRIDRVLRCLPPDWGDGYGNVRLCLTAENQRRLDERAPILLELPFRHKSIMCAPILSEIHLEDVLATGQIRHVIADGENYDGMRPCRYEWIKSLRDQCAQYGVPFDFVGTGNVFIKDGREYRICRAYHSVEAKRAGLDFPDSGKLPSVQPRCASCKMRDSCGGCRYCRKFELCAGGNAPYGRR